MVKALLTIGLIFLSLGGIAQDVTPIEGKYKPKLISLHVGYASNYIGRNIFTRGIIKFKEQGKFELTGGIKYHVNRDVPNMEQYAFKKQLYAVSAWNIPGLQLGFNYQLFSIKEKLKVQIGYLFTYSKLELQAKSHINDYKGGILEPYYLRTYPFPIYENYLLLSLKYRITKNIQLTSDIGYGLLYFDLRRVRLYKSDDVQGIYNQLQRSFGYTFSFGITYDLFRVKTVTDKNSK